jgi:hypothetical protein
MMEYIHREEQVAAGAATLVAEAELAAILAVQTRSLLAILV